MKFSELKSLLPELNQLIVRSPHGQVPVHFHITEVGKNTKHFIDCGGTVRLHETAIVQLWTANDTDHRLTPGKWLSILEKSESALGLEDLKVEVEYQNSDTKGIYDLGFRDGIFHLDPVHTDCLAKDVCLPRSSVSLPVMESSNCVPGGGCC